MEGDDCRPARGGQRGAHLPPKKINRRGPSSAGAAAPPLTPLPPSLSPQASDKLAALAAVAARVILSPALLLRSLLTAPDMVVWNEPCGYRSPGWRQWAAQAAGKGER